VRWQGNLCAGAGRFVLTAPATVHMPARKRAIEGHMMSLNNVGCGRNLFDLREMASEEAKSLQGMKLCGVGVFKLLNMCDLDLG
jgi:hypothetical protein